MTDQTVYTLGIETSCDETAAAVIKNGREILSNVISSQEAIHSRYGGVVPELAGRAHVDVIDQIILQALNEAGLSWQDIDQVAVTEGPGLAGSLLVGLNVAKAIAYALKIPIIGVNHLEGHLTSIYLQEAVEFPYIALSVSGGHTDLYRVERFGSYQLLGRTRDDAAGESFDKVAKMLGLGYPGGPLIEKLAREGNPSAHAFPRAMLGKDSLDFSFSGVKTSVKNFLLNRDATGLSDADVAASFQEAVIDTLVKKLLLACRSESISRAVVTGGVAANGALRARTQSVLGKEGIASYFPKPVYCTDNAAMIACAGHFKFLEQPERWDNAFSLDALANLSL